MAIDTSIYGNIKQVEIESPVNALAKLLQVQGLQQDHQLGQMKMDEYQRGLGEQNALRALLGQQGFDPSTTEGKAKLYGTSIKGAQDFYKNAAEVDYKKAETDAKNIEAAHNRIDLIGQGLGFLKDNPTMENAQGVINNFVQMGIMTPEVAQQKMLDFQKDPTPEGIKNLATMGFQAAIAGKEQLPKIQTSNIGGSTVTQAFDPVTGKVRTVSALQNTATPGELLTDKRTREEGAANRAVTVRGQNMTDARSKEQLQQGKVPQGYRYNAAGNLEYIPGGPADPNGGNKPLTEFQGKSAAFGDRAMKADRILTDLTGNYSPTAVNVKQGLGNVWGVGGALEAGANIALGANSQKAEQAQRDFINALLRQESGAAISSSEFDNAKKQYFPQPGDSKEVIAQKAANRKTAIDGFIRSAGPNAKLQQPANDIHSQAEAILRGGK